MSAVQVPPQPQRLRVQAAKIRRRAPPPALVLVLGFAALIAIGTLLLMLPISSQARSWTPPLEALFTSTSAVCVTGLVVVDTGTYWSGFGQVVILLLMQAGGFGFMTGSTLLLLLLVGRRTSLRDRIAVQQSLGAPQLGSVMALVRRIAVFTLALEAIGAAALGARFLVGGEAGDPIRAAWWGIFHSISAFNNAGFDLFGEFRSVTAFVHDPVVLGLLGGLVVVGGIGYAIVGDVWQKRRWRRLAVETRLVLLTTLALLVVGTVAIAAIEWTQPRTLGSLPAEARVLNAAFHSAVARTAGFNSLDTSALLEPTLFGLMALMFIGGASGSPAGGIKVNTFSVLLVAIVSTARGRPSAEAFGRRIQHETVYRALAVALLSIAFVFAVGFALSLTSRAPFIELIFETVSAFATVGLSTGITRELEAVPRVLLILAMFVGRLGPLTLVLALASQRQPVSFRPAVESVRIG
ncbi:MAG: Trk family potassium uptake protein [Chloroflexi bacterium]|nr:Trk family potassium uptake protein [Chloroflexota bacterium]